MTFYSCLKVHERLPSKRILTFGSQKKYAEFWLEECQPPCCHRSKVLQRAANPSNHHLAYLASVDVRGSFCEDELGGSKDLKILQIHMI